MSHVLGFDKDQDAESKPPVQLDTAEARAQLAAYIVELKG